MPCLCVTSSLGGVDGACGHWASPAWTAGSAQSVVKGQEWTCALPEHQLLHLHWLHQSSGWYWAHFPLIIILWCLDSLIYNKIWIQDCSLGMWQLFFSAPFIENSSPNTNDLYINYIDKSTGTPPSLEEKKALPNFGNKDGNIICVLKNCISTSVATVLKCIKWLYPYVPKCHWCLVMSFWLKVCM